MTQPEGFQRSHFQAEAGTLCNRVCCALYCLVARALSEGSQAHDAIEEGISVLRQNFWYDFLKLRGYEPSK